MSILILRQLVLEMRSAVIFALLIAGAFFLLVFSGCDRTGIVHETSALEADLARLEWLVPPSVHDTTKLERGYRRVEVLYGTNRNVTGDTRLSGYFGNSRTPLQYGSVTVSIPVGHRPGQLESPGWFRGVFFPTGDPEKDLMLLDLEPTSEQVWLNILEALLNPANSDGRTELREVEGRDSQREVLIFIHGYNNSFEDAARRTAQIANDVGFKGIPIFYSWPSRDSVSGYSADEATVEWAAPHFTHFLKRITSRTKSHRIHIVAHSMGNRIVAEALEEIARLDTTVVFNQIVLAAPDIDAQVFEEQIVPSIWPNAFRFTMYASSRDKALAASQKVHYLPRAGQSGPNLIVMEGLETIDASTVETDLIGHGYFAENKRVIDDLFMILEHQHPASDRNLRSRYKRGLQYWAFQ